MQVLVEIIIIGTSHWYFLCTLLMFMHVRVETEQTESCFKIDAIFQPGLNIIHIIRYLRVIDFIDLKVVLFFILDKYLIM
jgi:hypothetical protein